MYSPPSAIGYGSRCGLAPDCQCDCSHGEQLQDYLNTRVRRKGKASVPLSTVTLRKEVATLRACFNWTEQTGLLTGRFPNRGLRFPKGEDKRPFMTWEDIERRVGRGGLTPHETKRFWDSLFLDLRQIDEFLGYVKSHASRPWVYPMCVAAAHTGARRSELARLHIDDIDFEDKTVLVHDRKRVRGQRTTRRVPLTPVLEQVLLQWIQKDHPGGSVLFCHQEKAGHQPAEGETTIPITVDDAAATVLATGLRPMNRAFVHLTTDPDYATQVVAANGGGEVLRILAKQAADAGVAFFRANPHV